LRNELEKHEENVNIDGPMLYHAINKAIQE
jgi:hypothetical protein